MCAGAVTFCTEVMIFKETLNSSCVQIYTSEDILTTVLLLAEGWRRWRMTGLLDWQPQRCDDRLVRQRLYWSAAQQYSPNPFGHAGQELMLVSV